MDKPSWGEQVAAWVFHRLPSRLTANPERVMINVACLAFGVVAFFARLLAPRSLLSIWPDWLQYEWAAAMTFGGVTSLVGYWKANRSLTRVGMVMIMLCCVIYAGFQLIDFSIRQSIAVEVWFLGVAVAKAIRLTVSSSLWLLYRQPADHDEDDTE